MSNHSRSASSKPDRQSAATAPGAGGSSPSAEPALVTEKQKLCLYSLLEERGLSEEEIDLWIRQAANLDRTQPLTRRQASVLIDCLIRLTEPKPDSVN